MATAVQSPDRSLFHLSRSSLGTIGGAILASLCLCAPAGMPAAPATPEQPAAASIAYRQAMDSFNQEDYTRALGLLDRAPAAEKTSEQADVWNLRGAIHLHLHQYEKARAAFAKAIEKDPDLWAARFNQAEVSFRQKRFEESSRQFEELLGRTSRWFHSDERGFLQYKLLLADLLAGKEKPATTYVEEHRGDKVPPLMYCYLNAALEQRRGRTQQAAQWLAQADAHYSPAAEQIFAESFRSLGWFTQRSERLIAAARRHDVSSTTPTSVALVELMPGQQQTAPSPAQRPPDAPAKAPAVPPRENSAATALPFVPKPTFRTTAPPAPPTSPGDLGPAAQMPPSGRDDSALPEAAPAAGPLESALAAADSAQQAAPADPRAVYSTPVVLGKPTGGRSKPATPSTPAATTPPGSPTAAADSPAPTASPAASAAASPAVTGGTLPAASPAPAFMEKYEQAYIKFLGKDYPAAKALLNEAEAIQPKQPTAATLRSQIFKHYYEAAYMVYKKADYAATIEQLNLADDVQPGQPDALNLRGLTLSKQKDFEHAETSFKRAIQADPTFWAARFNYAELPFNYRNYTAARARFEELYSQTDAGKQPREAELTQFKVFLTLLLEGKVDGARSFMGHFSFTGSTPARYFCQSALEFYAGNMDKAQAEIDQANKEFPPQLVAIFKESFYRIGWLNDGSNPAGAGALAAAGAPAAPPAESPAAAATPAAIAPPTGSPTLAATTKGAPGAAPAATPTPAASPATVAAVSPSPAASPMGVAAASPLPAAVVPTGTPVPRVAPTPAASNAATPAETEAAARRHVKITPSENLLRIGLVFFVLVNFVYCTLRVLMAALNRQPRRALPIKRSPVYTGGQEEAEPDGVKAPR